MVKVPAARMAEVQRAADGLRAELAQVCARTGRDVAEVTVCAVTKTWPASDVQAALDAGFHVVGEARADELGDKTALLGRTVAWHFLGKLQSNKAKVVGGLADVVQSVDRAALLKPLAAGARDAGRVLGVLLQVSLDGDPTRGGALPEDLEGLGEQVAGLPDLRLDGLMAVAPLGTEPRRAFETLADLHVRLQAQHPAATVLSAGMSGDWPDAVAAGATLLRVGGALFGSRPPLLR